MSVCEHCDSGYCDTCSSYSNFLPRPTPCTGPRIMKPWTDDCKPGVDSAVWVKFEGDYYPRVTWILDTMFCSNSFLGEKITHWLETEPTPILP